MDFVSTPDSSSSSKMRNWLDLPTDVMSLIFLKLSTIDILLRAQWVCSSWRNISKNNPQFYRIIDTRSSWDLWNMGMVREAVERSCGQLAEISVTHFATDELLQFISEKSTSLRCLRLVDCESLTDNGLIEMVKKCTSLRCLGLVYCNSLTDNGLIEMVKETPELEELEICHCYSFTISVFQVVGPLCPRLKSFRLNYVDYWMAHSVAPSIAENMHELCHLDIFANKMGDDGLRSILDGCPHLKSLDLRRCFNIEFGGDLKERTANIQIRLPHDPTDDYEYNIDICSDEEDWDEDFDYTLDRTKKIKITQIG